MKSLSHCSVGHMEHPPHPPSSPHPPPLSSPPLPPLLSSPPLPFPLLPSPPLPSPPLPSQEHCCVLHSIIGWDCVVGEWARVEGYPNYPDPNDPFGELYLVGISLGQEWLVAALHLMHLVSSGVVLWCCKEAVAMLVSSGVVLWCCKEAAARWSVVTSLSQLWWQLTRCLMTKDGSIQASPF